MVLLGLVMWPPQLCSISLCRSSPNHDGNCQGQINHMCWIMVTTIDWAQLSKVDFLCMCVCAIVIEQTPAESSEWFFLLITHSLHAYSSWVLFHPVHILAQQLVCAAFVQHLDLFAFVLFCIKSLSVRKAAADSFSNWCDVPDEGGGDVRESPPTNLEKHESFSVMPFQHARAVQPLIEDFFIINLHVYDLLIKFVSTPGKLVRCTHNTCVVPAQTIENETLCFSLTWDSAVLCLFTSFILSSRNFVPRKLLLMSLVAVKNGTDDVTLLSDWLLFSVPTLYINSSAEGLLYRLLLWTLGD